MKLNVLAFAIPLFIGLMYLEYIVIKKRKYGYSNLHNSIANISVGIAERLCDVLFAGVFYFVYDTLQKNYGIFQIKPGVALWILLLIVTDFIWYWYHRFAHEINLFWALHIVHHQSEDFNFTVSARITILQAVLRTGFWCVLPLIGFPASMITGILLVHGLYPFFIHTRLIGKLGVIEYVLVTPSHHRVHHASNDKYLDKNYGDVFIIWDKLFGTFQKEEDEPVYGLTKPLNTYSFLWQHFHYFIELWIAVQKKDTVTEKCKTLFGRPDSIDPSVRQEAEKLFSINQTAGTIKAPLNTYVIWQMAFMLVALFGFILIEQNLSITFITCFTAFTLLTLINCGAIMEQKKWVFNIEFIRVFLIALISLRYASYQLCMPLILIAVTALVIYYRPIQNSYLKLVYR